jgi:hypothetical protein
MTDVVLSFNRAFSPRAPAEYRKGNYEKAEKAIIRACNANGHVPAEKRMEKLEKYRLGLRWCRQCKGYIDKHKFVGARCTACVQFREEELERHAKQARAKLRNKLERNHGISQGWCARLLPDQKWYGPFSSYDVLYSLALNAYGTESRVPEGFEIERIGCRGIDAKAVKGTPQDFTDKVSATTLRR